MLDPHALAAALTAMGVPSQNVLNNWPHIVAGLQWVGSDDHLTEVAAAATTVCETGVFWPIREEGDQAYLQNELGDQWQWMGRGDVQLTWRQGYIDASNALGMDLVDHPDLALDPGVAGKVLAWYFKIHNVPALANAGNWYGVRYAINGGYNGLAVFLEAINLILPLPQIRPNPHTVVSVIGILRQVPRQDGAHAINPAGQPVVLQVNQSVIFAPNPAPNQWHGQITTPHWACIRIVNSPVWGWFRRDQLRTIYG